MIYHAVVNNASFVSFFLRSAAVSINQNIRTMADISSNVKNVPTCHPISFWLDRIRVAEGGGVGEYSTKFYTKGSTPRSKSFTLLYTIFDRKGNPFHILGLDLYIPYF